MFLHQRAVCLEDGGEQRLTFFEACPSSATGGGWTGYADDDGSRCFRECCPDPQLVEDFALEATIDADEYARAAVSKAKGNAAFVAQDFGAAAAEYEGALGAYGERGGAAGEQREEKAKICSNLAGSSSSSGRRRPRRRVTRWRSRRRTPRASCVAPRPP